MTMTDSERIRQLEEAVGVAHLMSPRMSEQEIAENRPDYTFPSGDYNLAYRVRQIGISQDSLVKRMADDVLPTVGELRALVAAQTQLLAEQAARITTLEMRPPPVSVATDLPVGGSQQAVRDVRSIKDLRDAGHVVSFDATALRRPAEVHTGDHAFTGRVAIGADHVLDLGGHLQVMTGGEILFHSRVAAANTQEKDRDRTRLGSVSFNPYDNGVRFIRGAAWRGGVMHHNPDDPRVQILAMDSQGTVSKSVEDYTQEFVERSQLWIVQEDFEAKKIRVIACRAGWGVEVAAGTITTNDRVPPDKEHLFLDRRAPLINALPGAV